jgi:hypothetical protein
MGFRRAALGTPALITLVHYVRYGAPRHDRWLHGGGRGVGREWYATIHDGDAPLAHAALSMAPGARRIHNDKSWCVPASPEAARIVWAVAETWGLVASGGALDLLSEFVALPAAEAPL